jgi:hypothetical protein
MQNAAAAQALENVALLEEWVQLLRSRDEAAQVEAQASDLATCLVFILLEGEQ